jgi:hypothetical protein
MRGIETKLLLALILMILIFVIVYIIIVQPAIGYAQRGGEEISFREFCFHWSILGYPLTDTITVGQYSYSVSEYCAKAGAPDPATDPECSVTECKCVKICKVTV